MPVAGRSGHGGYAAAMRALGAGDPWHQPSLAELRRFGGIDAPVWTMGIANILRALSLLAFSWSPLEHHAVPIDRPIGGVLSLLLGMALLNPRWRVPWWVLHANVLAIVVTSSWYIATATGTLGIPLNLTAVVAVVVYAGAWFRGRDLALHLLIVVVLTFLGLVAHGDPRVFLLNWLAAIISGAYASAMVHLLMGQILRMANRDALTGVLNRAGLMTITERPGPPESLVQPVSVVVLDLDGFKLLNDSRGHLAGDAMLVEVGRYLVSQCRTSDVVARTGGDEFVLILGGTEPDAARALVERVRAGMPIEASFGLAVWRAGEPFDRAMAAADAAMYVDKASRQDDRA